jgi:hypothetical protein
MLIHLGPGDPNGSDEQPHSILLFGEDMLKQPQVHALDKF